MIYAQLAIAAYGAYKAYQNKPNGDAARAYQAAMAQLQSVPVPDPESLKVQMQQLVQQGAVSPEDAQAITVQHNAYDEVTGNDQARGAQLEVLQGFQDQASAGGLTDTSRAAIQANLDTTANTERGQRQAIGQDARRRGISGSGLELAQQLMSQQSSADQAGRRGMDIAALAEQSKIEALKNAANLGTTVQGQDVSQQENKAAAANQIAQYNATNQQQVTLQNIAARNAAQEANLAQKQRISDANTGMENQNRIRNADLVTDTYDRRMDKAKSVANLASGQASQMSRDDDKQRAYQGDFTGGILKTVGDFGSTYSPPKRTTMPIDTSSNSFLTNDALQRKKVLGYAHGGKVPGKAPLSGDSPENDTVPAKLSPGELVIKRSKASNPDEAAKEAKRLAGGGTSSPTDTATETGGSNPGGASTGGVGSGIGGAGTGGAATGGASTGGAGTVTLTISGDSGGGKKGKGSKAPTTINISHIGGNTDAGNVKSGDGPGASGRGGKGDGSGGGGGGGAPDEPTGLYNGGKVESDNGDMDDLDSFLNNVPRTANKPRVDVVKDMLQALTEMGC